MELVCARSQGPEVPNALLLRPQPPPPSLSRTLPLRSSFSAVVSGADISPTLQGEPCSELEVSLIPVRPDSPTGPSDCALPRPGSRAVACAAALLLPWGSDGVLPVMWVLPVSCEFCSSSE